MPASSTTILGTAPLIMGIVNVTPDSFSDGGDFYDPEQAIAHGLQMLKEGANILDVGGESTRPGADIISPEEEIRRVIPVIEALKQEGVSQISIDTRNAKTMEAALEVGATIINDISALNHDPKSVEIASNAQAPVILMHMQGTPQNMQKNPNYNNVIKDVFSFFKERILFCETNRIDKNRLILDPGIGFGKTLEHNLLLLRNIKKFHELNCPLLLGLSRKSFIGAISEQEDANARLPGSLAGALWGLSQGAQIFRVHDVKETKQAFKVFEALSHKNAG